MVVFTCGHCGESVQKPKVEKHYLTKCRNRNPNLSCMDCFKDFLGDAYEAHTKCITEEERYSGKGFVSKEKKGEKKQNTWVVMVQEVLDEQKSAPSNVLRIIETVSKFNNTPRKKPKFINFVKNVCGQKTNPKDIDQAWDLIAIKLAALSSNNQSKNLQNKNAASNGNTEENGDNTLVNGNSVDVDSKIDKSDEKVNGDTVNKDDTDNGEAEPDNVPNTEENSNKKLSKKQRKEEKKRKKYEAELQSAVEAPPESEEITDAQPSKKGKKKKTKSESNYNEETQDSKNKKRKRQDTVNSVQDTPVNGQENIENEPLVTKASKKKIKVQEEEADDSICLHDQNVAKIEELTMNSEKFNWHAVIKSVLQKKDNEVPFKRLQKKVLMEYSEATGQDVDDRIAEKFIKKLKSAPNVRVDKNRVLLLE